MAAYWPALHGGFLWDDSGHVTRSDLRPLGGLGRIWLEIGATQQYYPLLHSAFWFEHRLWGDAVPGYHLVNLLLHAIAATLFGVLLRRLAVPGAWLAAALFLLHPVCVESVAWISEQKNTLSLVLYLCTALAYLDFDRSRSPRAYLLALLLFVGALLTKTVTASLPAALLVVFWWRRGRLDWRRDLVPLLPWFALGVGGGLFTAHFERVLIGAQGADFAPSLGVMDRVVLAGRVFWFYLGKLFWPAELIFVYPHWSVAASVWWQWLFPAAGLGLFATLAWRSRRARGPLAAALLFGGSLFPKMLLVSSTSIRSSSPMSPTTSSISPAWRSSPPPAQVSASCPAGPEASPASCSPRCSASSPGNRPRSIGTVPVSMKPPCATIPTPGWPTTISA